MDQMIVKVLKTLEIENINLGAASGNFWLTQKSSTLHTSYTPIDGQAIAKVRTASEEDYEILINRAQKAFEQWRIVPAPQRGEVVRQIAERLRYYKEALALLVSLEMGKSKVEGLGEVQEMIDMADFAVGQARMLYGKTMHSERPQHRMYEQWHPYGLVGVITAFNFPVAVWAWNAFLAAICGNITIWKPSDKVSLCAVAVQKICNQVLTANHYPEIFSFFITEHHALAERLLNDSRIPLISFTGSTHTGKMVAKTVANRLGKCILELGGNNAIIVDETADLKLALPAIVFGAVGTAGQRCTSTRRLIVHHQCYEEIIKKLKAAYQQVTIGNPLDEQNLMGPLINRAAIANYSAAIEKCKAYGARLVFGGNVLEKKGYYVDPALITDVKNDWDIIQHETFAPILYVMPYHDLAEAIALYNGVKQGLSGSIFTTNLKNAEYFLSVVGADTGIANVNVGTSGAEIGGAFGGEKDTGGGREAGSDCWKYYMRRQTNTINWGNTLPLAQGIKFENAGSLL